MTTHPDLVTEQIAGRTQYGRAEPSHRTYSPTGTVLPLDGQRRTTSSSHRLDGFFLNTDASAAHQLTADSPAYRARSPAQDEAPALCSILGIK